MLQILYLVLGHSNQYNTLYPCRLCLLPCSSEVPSTIKIPVYHNCTFNAIVWGFCCLFKSIGNYSHNFNRKYSTLSYLGLVYFSKGVNSWFWQEPSNISSQILESPTSTFVSWQKIRTSCFQNILSPNWNKWVFIRTFTNNNHYKPGYLSDSFIFTILVGKLNCGKYFQRGTFKLQFCLKQRQKLMISDLCIS